MPSTIHRTRPGYAHAKHALLEVAM